MPHQQRLTPFFLPTIWNSFKVMLLTRGMPAYIGEAGASIDYFGSIGYPCPPNTNPADHLLDMTNSGMFVCVCIHTRPCVP